MKTVRSYLHIQRWFLAIVVLSLAIKILFLYSAAVVNSDGVLYIAAAKQYCTNGFSAGMQYYPMPFYPLLLCCMHHVVGDWVLAGRLLSLVPLLFALVPLYMLTCLLFERSAALWSVLLFAVLPVFNEGSISIMRDPLFLLFFLSAMVCLVSWCQQHRMRYVLYFLLWAGLALLTRIEGVLLLGVAGLLMLRYNMASLPMRTFFLRWTILTLLASALLWGLHGSQMGAALRLSEVVRWLEELTTLKVFALYHQLQQQLRELQQASAAGNYHNNLFEVTRHYAPLIYLVGLTEMVAKALYPTSLLALIALRWRGGAPQGNGGRRGLGVLWYVVVAFMLMNLIFVMARNFTTERYLWVPIVLMLPWLGSGVDLWWQKLRGGRGAVWLVLTLIFVSPLTKTLAVATTTADTTVVTAGQWLHNYDPQRSLEVIYDDRRLPLYADRVEDVRNVMGLDQIYAEIQRGATPDVIALYLSNKKNQQFYFSGYTLLRQFVGEENTVIFYTDTSH